MGIGFWRPLLQSLCCSSPWNYAVFWKLKHQQEMVLVWEDGFCDILKPKDSVACSYLENPNKILSSTFSPVAHDGNPGEYSVGLAGTEMSSASHVVGKGIIGGVAYTGNACWIYSDNIRIDMRGSDLVPEYPEEWWLQFAAGIKTILVLPVTGQGVLQLGSLARVAETESLVIDVKEKFKAHEISDGSHWSYSTQQFSLLSTFIDQFEEPSTITTEKTNEDHNSIHAVMLKDCNLFANQMSPAFTVQNLCNTSARGLTDTFENVIDSEICQQSLGIIHAAEASCEDSISVATENNILKSYYLDERVGVFPYCDDFDERIYEDLMNEVMDIHSVEYANEPAFVVGDFDNATSGSGNNLLSFPGDCELPEALGPAIVGNIYQYIYDTSLLTQNVDQTSVDDRQTYDMDMSGPRPIEFPIEEVDMEQLLEAIVANAWTSSDDNSSYESNVTSCNISSEKLLASPRKPNQSKRLTSVEEDAVPWSFMTSALTGQKRKVSSAESKISVLAKKPRQRKGYDSLKLSRLSNTNKKRVRSEDNQKTRPRDRQLIQERIKELRELVPNSEKCSIDGLLDKTIKHMFFLKGVTSQAEKLKHHILEEETNEKIMKTTEVNNGLRNGASWAVELGNEQQMCPIVVKDLDRPGHMLIEMLCTDHARFLEIADVIHRLELTIIKGVMENCSDNSWARFVVETSGSFHRLDIFWPLMQLLQQSRPPISCKI